MSDITYTEALAQSDPTAVTAITAPAGAVDRIGEFGGLTDLDLSGNTSVTDFGFLSSLPNLTRLNLSAMNLSEIPAEVAGLAKLERLILGKNPITDFSLLATLPALIDLGVEEMSLRKVPDGIAALTNLEVLSLFDNNIASISAVAKLTNLRHLYVASNKLKKIPKELKKLTKLTMLHMGQNYSLKDWAIVGELENLEELSMTNSHEIKQLPGEIFALEKLRELSLSIHWNAPEDVLVGLETIERLANLEVLEIHGAAMRALPPGMSALKKLKRLDLRDNKALANVDALADLPSLEVLDLSKNEIETIGDSFSTLKALRTLNLSHNKPLTDISGLRDLPALEELELFSELKALPEELGTLTALKQLKVSAKADDVSFLDKLENLEELYIANCRFDGLPANLSTLKRLTVFRDEGSDDYLTAFTDLEELKVTQPSFVVPALPNLRTLSVGRIKAEADFSALGKLENLEELAIHRSDSAFKSLPTEIASVTSLKRLELEFLKIVEDLSAVRDLPGLEELSIRYCDRLTALAPELATLTGLRELNIYAVEKLEDIEVIGSLVNLEELDLERIAAKALPQGLATLEKLSRVCLDDLDNLEDISALEKTPNLTDFSCDDCSELKRKTIAKVDQAIAERRASGSGADLKMSYAEFISSKAYRKLDGKEDSTRTYSFPLWFGEAETLLDAADDFSWLDDYRDDGGEEAGESALKVLAILDFGADGCDPELIDSYSEEIFLVDTEHPQNPVYIWGHDGSPSRLHETFDDFLASLRDFTPEDDD